MSVISGVAGAAAATATKMLVAVGASNGTNGTILTSTDAVAWVPRASNAGNVALIAITRSPLTRRYVAIGSSGIVVTSDDLTTWTVRGSGTTATMNAITAGSDDRVVVGRAGDSVSKSGDGGMTWGTSANLTGSGDILCMLFVSNQYVAGYSNGQICVFPWIGGPSTRTSQFGSSAIRGAVYGGGQCVIVGDSGKISTSPDSSVWTARTSGVTDNLKSVTYGAGQYVAVGKTSTARILTSPDGITWTIRPHGMTSPQCVTHNGVAFVVGGAGGQMATSADGVTWTNVTSGTTVSINGINAG